MSDFTEEEMIAANETILETMSLINTPETERRFGIEGTFNMYSVGMKDNYDLPDLEMRGIPGMLLNAAASTINEINAYRLISDKPVLVDQHISWKFGDIQTEQGDDWDGAHPHKAEDMIRLTSYWSDVPNCECCQFEEAGVTE
jgi:hypothetical protein